MSERGAPVDEAPSELVRRGREAFSRHAWEDAFELLSRADRETARGGSSLPGEDLELLAMAAFFAARADARLEILERAFKAHEAAGDKVRAAYVALDIASWMLLQRKGSIGSGWRRRAERLLAGEPEGYAHAYLALIRSDTAKASGDIDRAVALAAQAVEVSSRTDHADVRAMALAALAVLKIATGTTSEGIELLEEAAISAVSGDLSLITAGVTSCQMISVCRDLTDYQRASQWLAETDRWCKRQEVSGFPGICRVHRAEISALEGRWDRAEQELQQATAELEAYDAFPPLADGLYALGEIRRLRGDFAAAEEVLRQAHSFGRSPQPALALIRLSAGKTAAAQAAIRAALDEPSWDQWARARLLGAQVEIALAAGDAAGARAAADELGGIGADYRSPAFEAGRRQALGRVLLAEGDASGAARELRAATRSWREVGSPYDEARARWVLSRALRELGDEDDADLELRAARDTFDRLGAVPDLAQADAELRSIADRRNRPVQVRMTFVFTDIAGSTTLAEALGDEAWERLLAWHDDALLKLFDRHGGRVVNSTGDGFFVAFESADRAVVCAVAVQRALDEHRRKTGFAPPVRIGVHTADATRRGDDFSGIGVHVAARIGALARGGEIVASADTLAEAPGVAAATEREVEVKGVSAPVRVAAISWS